MIQLMIANETDKIAEINRYCTQDFSKIFGNVNYTFTNVTLDI